MRKKDLGDYVVAILGLTAFTWLWVATLIDYLFIGD